MDLPPHSHVTIDGISAMAEHHGLSPRPITRLSDSGIFNAIYAVGDRYILRVPRRHPGHFRALHNESIVVPLARSVGVRTPDLVVYDDSCTLLPVPYTVYERVEGETLSHLELEPDATPIVWRDLGRDLALLHTSLDRAGPAEALPDRETLPDPRALAGTLASGGWITGSEERWLLRWLERLAPAALAEVHPRLSHGDTQSSNVMVRSGEYAAVLDWGGASWGDPVLDFGGVPLRAVPYMLEGYRGIAPMEADGTAEARIVWWHLQLALFTAWRGPQPGHSWAERPLTMLVEISRFFLGHPPGPWQDVRPP